MDELKKNWLTDGLIDFEYKKYVLLAYIQNVKVNFEDRKLYPFLSDLVFHYQNLVSLKENKKLIYENFPKVITKADFEKLTLTYKKIVEDDEVMKQIEDILEFSIPQFRSALKEGKDIYEFVEQNVEIGPVGLTPLYANEGYLFINEYPARDVKIYRYQISVFESADEKYRGVHTDYISTETLSIGKTYENLKLSLTRQFGNLPNPAAYMVESRSFFPFNETLLPVAKRLLVRYIASSDTK
jgi:hypothetical protein